MRWTSSDSRRLVIVLVGAGVESLMSLGQVVGKVKPYSFWSLPAVYAVLAVLFVGYAALIAGLMYFSTRISLSLVKPLGVCALFVCILGFFYMYPKYGVPANLAGYGDRDDAINQMVRAAIQGSNPYGIRTYLGNPASPLLGGAALGAPWVITFGSCAYLNPVILLCAGFLALRSFGSRCALFLICAVQFNIGFMVDYFVGGDVFTVPLLFACVISIIILQSHRLGPVSVCGLVVVTALAATSRVTTALAGIAMSLYAIFQFRGRERRLLLTCFTLILGIVFISLILSGGPSSWPFSGSLSPWEQNTVRVLTLMALSALVFRWSRAVGPSVRSCEMARASAYLSIPLIPVLLVCPFESSRLWTFLLLATPWAAIRITAALPDLEQDEANLVH